MGIIPDTQSGHGVHHRRDRAVLLDSVGAGSIAPRAASGIGWIHCSLERAAAFPRHRPRRDRSTRHHLLCHPRGHLPISGVCRAHAAEVVPRR